MTLFHEIRNFETVKSKVIISLFETVKLSVSISPRNLYNSLKSIKERNLTPGVGISTRDEAFSSTEQKENASKPLSSHMGSCC